MKAAGARRRYFRDIDLMRLPSRSWVIGMMTSLCTPCITYAQNTQRPPVTTAQIEQATQSLWRIGGNDRPLCTFINQHLADQSGYQELVQQFLPGQWVLRYAASSHNQGESSSKAYEVSQLEFLARQGLIEKSVAPLTLGVMRGPIAYEYRATNKGWSMDIFQGDKSSGPCFYYGRGDVLRVVNFSESERDASGYNTIKVDFIAGVAEFAEWARDEQAAVLFPAIRESKEGRPNSWTLFRTPSGRLELSRGSGRYLDDPTKHLPRPAEEHADANAALQALEHARTTPGHTESERLPKPCLSLTQRSPNGPVLWKAGDKAAANAVTFSVDPKISSGEPPYTYVRLVQLSQAGLLTLTESRHNTTVSSALKNILVTPHHGIRKLLVENGDCLPLGEVRIEVLGVAPNESGGVRVKARHVVTKPASWINLIKDVSALPDLANVLQYGYPFEGTVYKSQQGWRAAYISAHSPRHAPPSLRAVGVATSWLAAFRNRQLELPSISDSDLHIITITSTPNRADIPRRVAEGFRNSINIYVNPAERPSILLLNAYDATFWNISLAPEARVAAVLALGYHEQVVKGLPAYALTLTVKRHFNGADGSLTRMGSTDGSHWLQSIGTKTASLVKTNGARPVIINP